MARPEDLILKKFQTNIAQHEGRIKEAEAEGGAASRVIENAVLEGELASESFDMLSENIFQPLKQMRDEKRFKDFQNSPEQQRKKEQLFRGNNVYDKMTNNLGIDLSEVRKGMGMLENDHMLQTSSWLDMGDKDIQTIFRSSVQTTWIDAITGNYETSTLDNPNNVSDNALEVLARDKKENDAKNAVTTAQGITEFRNPNDETFKKKDAPVDEHDGPADTEDISSDETTYTTDNTYKTTSLKEMLENYEKLYDDDATGIYYKNIYARAKIGNIKRAIKHIQKDTSKGYWLKRLKLMAPDIHAYMTSGKYQSENKTKKDDNSDMSDENNEGMEGYTR